MAMFKTAATEQLKLLALAFVLGNSYRVLLRASPDDNASCGRDLRLRVDASHDRLVLATLAAGTLLLAVRTALDAAEASAVAAAHAAAAVKGIGSVIAAAKAFDADGAAARGIGSVAARWKRLSLRLMLLLAAGLSLAASFLAVAVFEDGFLHRTGCPAVDGWVGPTSPVAVALMALLALVHGAVAWVAVSKD